MPSDQYDELMACVGRNGGPYGFQDYSLGYFEAARSFWKSIRSGNATTDIAVYPLAYLYRQGIELALKQLVSFLAAAYRSAEQPSLNHGLMNNWRIARRLLEMHRQEYNWAELQDAQLDGIERILDDFESIDAGSFTFRYPVDKKGSLFLQDRSRIDLAEANRILEAASHWFSDLAEGVKEDLFLLANGNCPSRFA